MIWRDFLSLAWVHASGKRANAMTFTLGSRAEACGHRVDGLARIGSTNAEALRRARAGERGPLWLATADQMAGRGRRGRDWQSPPGNLAASFLEIMRLPPAAAATLGFVAGIASRRALAQMSAAALSDTGRGAEPGSRPQFELKWPNDVLAGGAKIAGILLECETAGSDAVAVAVGIGVNVVAAPSDVPYPATSLAAIGVAASAEAVFAALGETWADALRVWDHGRGFAEIRQEWLAHAAGLGHEILVVTDGIAHAGMFETIDADGRLVLTTAGGARTTISAGDVFFGRAAGAGAGR